MKRLIIATVIMSVLIAVCTVSHITVENVADNTEKLLITAKSAVEENDTEKAAKICRDLSDYWSCKAGGISLFTDHGKVENMSVLLKKLEASIGTPDFYQLSEEIKLKTEELKSNEKITVAGF